jgi:hypothetical integral membrane protein (TIGR02206 family)
MDGFFGPEPNRIVFAEYGPLHWLAVAGLVVCVALVVVFRRSLRERPGVRRWLPVVIGVVAWVFEIAYHVWTYVHHLDFLVSLLPFELCAVSLWVAMILAFWRSRALFQYFYFISFGAVLSYAFPDLGGYGPDHFRFWHYFLVHGFIILMCAWCLVVERFRLRRDALVRFLAVMVPYSAVMYVVDRVFGVNYLFLAGPTQGSSPLDFFGTGWAYVVKLVGLALVVFFLMYLAAPKEPRNRKDIRPKAS